MDPPWLRIVNRIIDIIEKVLTGTVNWRTALSLIGAWLIFVYLLPPEDRKNAGFRYVLDAITGSVAQSLMGLLGWAIVLILVLVGAPLLWLAHRRLQRVGGELAQRRDRDDPDRLSSQDEERLAQHKLKSHTRIRTNDADQEDKRSEQTNSDAAPAQAPRRMNET